MCLRCQEFILTSVGFGKIRRQLPQVIFKPLSPRDVTRYLRRTNHVSGIILQWGDGERNDDVLTVATHTLGFEVFDSVSLFEPRDDVFLFSDSFVWDDQRNVLAQSLFG